MKKLGIKPLAMLGCLAALLLVTLLIKGNATAANVTGKLTVRVHTMPAFSDKRDIKLCFSNPANCITLTRSIGNFYEYNGEQFGDHPFVDHPDDWDHLYLSRGPGFSLVNHIYIEYETSRSFEFVNWTAPGGMRAARWLTGKQDIDLTEDIEFSRRKKVVEAMGVSDLSRANVNAVFESLPDIVRSGAHDIGQSGFEKYAGEPNANQWGCDEFYCWHYVNTDFDDAYATLDKGCENCCSGDPAWLKDRCFSYDPDARPSPFVCKESIFPHHGFKQHGRLSKVIFKESDGKRTEIDKILRVNPSVGGSDYDLWQTTTSEYQPKIGDMLVRYANCPAPDGSKKDDGTLTDGDDMEKGGSSHMMMLLSDMSNPDERLVYECSVQEWDGCLNARMMEGSGIVLARKRQIIEVNQKCPDGRFWYDLYVGELR